MILGLSLGAFTVFHVILSLVGIGSGFVAVFGLINNRLLRRWTALFTAPLSTDGPSGDAVPSRRVQLLGVVPECHRPEQ